MLIPITDIFFGLQFQFRSRQTQAIRDAFLDYSDNLGDDFNKDNCTYLTEWWSNEYYNDYDKNDNSTYSEILQWF